MTDKDGDGWYEYTVRTADEFDWVINNGGSKKTREYTTKGDKWVKVYAVDTLKVYDSLPD